MGERVPTDDLPGNLVPASDLPDAPSTFTKTAEPEEPSTLMRVTKALVGPESSGMLGGAAVGARLGAAAGPVGAFMGGVVGAGAGAMLGRGYELAVTPELNDPNTPGTIAEEIALASQRGMVGQTTGLVIGKALGGGAKFVLSHLPGSAAARVEMAIANVRDNLANRITAATGKYFRSQETVSAIDPSDRVPATEIVKTLDSIIGTGKSHTTAGQGSAFTHAKELRDRLAALDNQPSIHWLDRELTAVGEQTRALASDGKAVDPQFSRLFKSMAQTLEQTDPQRVYIEPRWLTQSVTRPNPRIAEIKEEIAKLHPLGNAEKIAKLQGEASTISPTIQQEVSTPTRLAMSLNVKPSGKGALVLEKDSAYRQMAGLKDVEEIFNNLVKTKRGMDNAIDVNANQVLDKLHKNDFLMKSLPKDDLADIEAILSKVADLPALPPPKGVMFGAGRTAGITGVTGAGLMALGVGAGPAALIGASMAGLADLSRVLLPSRIGRKLLRSALEAGPLDMTTINALAPITRALSGYQLGVTANESDLNKAYTDSMKVPQIDINEKITIASEFDQMKKAAQAIRGANASR